jgi:hypothetical protein
MTATPAKSLCIGAILLRFVIIRIGTGLVRAIRRVEPVPYPVLRCPVGQSIPEEKTAGRFFRERLRFTKVRDSFRMQTAALEHPDAVLRLIERASDEFLRLRATAARSLPAGELLNASPS